MNIKNAIKKYIFKIEPLSYKKKNTYFDFIEPDAFFDVGANVGMSAEHYLSLGYNVPVYSFEPVSHLYKELKLKADSNSRWNTFNVGIGDVKDKLSINVSGGHGGASSFLQMTDEFKSIAPDQEVGRTETVDIITLSDFYNANSLDHKRIFLKIDVQGFELNVLKGSSLILDKIVGLKVETSIKKQYYNEPDVFEILPYILNLGFSVYGIEEGWRNPVNKELLQIDLFLFNQKLINYNK